MSVPTLADALRSTRVEAERGSLIAGPEVGDWLPALEWTALAWFAAILDDPETRRGMRDVLCGWFDRDGEGISNAALTEVKRQIGGPR